MADEKLGMPENDHLAPAERAYFESRGEKAIPPEPPPAQSQQPELPLRPEQRPEPSVTAVPSEPENKIVSHGALHEERARRKEAEERARQAELLQARMEERFRAWQQQSAPRPQPPAPPVDPNKDIFGAVQQMMTEQRQTAQKVGYYEREMAAQEQLRRVGQWAAQLEIGFQKVTPDYDQALRHLREMRLNELKAGFGMDDNAANSQLIAEERQLLIRAVQTRQNPAKMAYDLARARGFTQRPADGNGSDAERKFDRIESGQQASRSLSNVGGRAGGGVDITLKDLVSMSDADFATFKARNPAKYRRLKGG